MTKEQRTAAGLRLRQQRNKLGLTREQLTARLKEVKQ